MNRFTISMLFLGLIVLSDLSIAAESPSITNGVVTFSILSSDDEIPDNYQVERIRIDQNINRISRAEIVLLDGNPAEETFQISESETFLPGAVIEIRLGYENQNEGVFKGIVTQQRIRTDHNGSSRLHVICHDATIKLNGNKMSAMFTEMKVSDVIQRIYSSHGITAVIPSTDAELVTLSQDDLTDWEFITELAGRAGMLVVTDLGRLIITKPDVTSEPLLRVDFGTDLIGFDMTLDAMGQYPDVKIDAIDASSAKKITTRSIEPTVNKQGNLTGKKLAEMMNAETMFIEASEPANSKTIQTWADAELLKARLSRIRGSVTFKGSARAKVNTLIYLEGLGKRFNGNAFISGVYHTIEAGQWTTEVDIGIQ